MFIEPYSQGYNLFKLVGTVVVQNGMMIVRNNGERFIPNKDMVLKILAPDIFEVYEKTDHLIQMEQTGLLQSDTLKLVPREVEIPDVLLPKIKIEYIKCDRCNTSASCVRRYYDLNLCANCIPKENSENKT